MPSTHLALVCCSVCLLLAQGRAGVAAQPEPPAPEGDRVPPPGAFERLAEVFAPPGTPSVKDKAWVAVDTGPANMRSDLHGWLIHDGPREITLLDWYGELHK